MKESKFGFEYSWSDLQPVRALAFTVFCLQIIGGVLGLLLTTHSELFLRIWFGAALATFPGFLIGLFVQWRLQPGSIRENLVMVRRMGLIALVLSLVAIFMPQLGFK